MKRLILLLAFLPALLAAQPNDKLRGLVTEQSSGNKPLAGVQVVSSWANPTVSSTDGTFTLVFFAIKPGEAIHLEAKKEGWEVVNEKEMHSHLPENYETVPLKIVMCLAGVLAQNRLKYYDISEKVITRKYEQQIAALNKEKVDWEQEQSRITEAYESQLKYARDLAEKFARTNFDDVSDLYRKAFDLYQRGQIDSALTVLEAADLIRRAGQRISEREKIAKGREELDQRERENEAGIKEDMQAIRLAAELYAINYENDKAVEMYEQLIALDTTHLGNLLDVAEFYKERKYYDKALASYRHLLTKPLDVWQKGNIYSYIGELETEIGRLPASLEAYRELEKIYQQLYKKENKNAFFKQNLAISYSKLGETYAALGALDTALRYYEQYNGLKEELYRANPRSESLKRGLALSWGYLGQVYLQLTQLDSAQYYGEKALAFFEEMTAANPQSANLVNGLGESYSHLAAVYLAQKQTAQARMYYQKALAVFKPLYERTQQPQHQQKCQEVEAELEKFK